MKAMNVAEVWNTAKTIDHMNSEQWKLLAEYPAFKTYTQIIDEQRRERNWMLLIVGVVCFVAGGGLMWMVR